MTPAAQTPAGVLLVAFGSTEPEARALYAQLGAAAAARYPGRPLAWGLGSGVVRRRLAAAGVATASPAEALAALHAAGCDRVALQSWHVTPGEEYGRLAALAHPGVRLARGAPLLGDAADLDAVADILAAELRPDVPNLLAMHGSDRAPAANVPLLALAARLQARHPAVYAASLEGQPGPAALDAAIPAVRAAGAVHVVPLLVAPGGHLSRDIGGDRPDSWLVRLGRPRATFAPVLGAHPRLRERFFLHLDRALADLA